MKILPKIIQGGMGAGVSDWRLPKSVSNVNIPGVLPGTTLGTVSGTALDILLAYRLQTGDKGGHLRRALSNFPNPDVSKRVLDKYFISGGKSSNTPFIRVPMHTLNNSSELIELTVLGNFAQVFLAKEGHNNPVGINYLEKLQLPHLYSIYGALLAGVNVIAVGAGIPLQFPEMLERLVSHETASYNVALKDKTSVNLEFKSEVLNCTDVDLTMPDKLAIVSLDSLAKILDKRAPGQFEGYVVESELAGGHHTPPRNKNLDDEGNLIYTERDEAKLNVMRDLGLPFWLAGTYDSPERLDEALSEGATGVQIGTSFAFCEESGIYDSYKRKIIQSVIDGNFSIHNDPFVSPTGFPFNVLSVDDSLSEQEVFLNRKKVCDLGFLRVPYKKEDESYGLICPAEPEASFLAKGGNIEETKGRVCLCNGLLETIGMGHDGEPPLFTAGNNVGSITDFLSEGETSYSAKDVIKKMLRIN